MTITAGDGYREALQRDSSALNPKPADFVAYGERRIGELHDAVRVLGDGRVQLRVLGFPDGGSAHRKNKRALADYVRQAAIW